MKKTDTFKGFSSETLDFYRRLRDNNSREWLEENRDIYNRHVLEPSRSFVVALGEKLEPLAPGIHAEPRINRSLFKIHRDVRFSRDKSPLKDHLAFYFWSGSGPRMEMPGFYFHIEPERIMFASGLYSLTKDQLKVYRDSVVDEMHGAALEKILKKIAASEKLTTGTLHYKKTPRGYDSEHPRNELLRCRGIHCAAELSPGDFLYTDELLDVCVAQYRPMLPLYQWCCELIERME